MVNLKSLRVAGQRMMKHAQIIKTSFWICKLVISGSSASLASLQRLAGLSTPLAIPNPTLPFTLTLDSKLFSSLEWIQTCEKNKKNKRKTFSFGSHWPTIMAHQSKFSPSFSIIIIQHRPVSAMTATSKTTLFPAKTSYDSILMKDAPSCRITLQILRTRKWAKGMLLSSLATILSAQTSIIASNNGTAS